MENQVSEIRDESMTEVSREDVNDISVTSSEEIEFGAIQDNGSPDASSMSTKD